MAMELEMGLNFLELMAWLAVVGIMFFKYRGQKNEGYWNFIVGFLVLASIAGLHLAEMMFWESHLQETVGHIGRMIAAILLLRGLLSVND